MAGGPFELEGLEHAVHRLVAVEHAVEPVLVAVCVPVGVPPGAAIANVPAIDRHREATGTQPLHDQLGIAVGAEQEIARGVELPRSVDERNSGLRRDLRLHCVLLYSVGDGSSA
jgi:hypothetical protein